jgi:hypothetical protein
MPKIKVVIGKDHRQWLQNHPAINFSGLVQEIIREERAKQQPFSNDGKMWKGRKRVILAAYVDSDLQNWLNDFRNNRPKESKKFLSFYVQKRLDYIMTTGIISGTVEFRKSLEMGY